MATSTVTTFTDDLNGMDITDNDQPTVRFSLDGVDYEIDLNAANAAMLRQVMKPFIKASHYSTEPTAAFLREWARNNGWDVPDRGRIDSRIRAEYMATL